MTSVLGLPHELTDGLASNLVAEFAGFLGSTIVTFAIINRVIDARRERLLTPLRQRFALRVQAAVSAIAATWAMGLSERMELLGQPAAAVQERAMAVDAATLRASWQTKTADFVRFLAQRCIENVKIISSAADRFYEALSHDVTLLELVEDLENASIVLEEKLASQAVLDGGTEDEIIVEARNVLQQASQLSDYLAKHEKKAPS